MALQLDCHALITIKAFLILITSILIILIIISFTFILVIPLSSAVIKQLILTIWRCLCTFRRPTKVLSSGGSVFLTAPASRLIKGYSAMLLVQLRIQNGLGDLQPCGHSISHPGPSPHPYQLVILRIRHHFHCTLE